MRRASTSATYRRYSRSVGRSLASIWLRSVRRGASMPSMSSRASASSKRGALSADSHGCRTATRPSTARSRWNQACQASMRRKHLLEEGSIRVGLVQDAYGGGEHRRLGDPARRHLRATPRTSATPRAPRPGCTRRAADGRRCAAPSRPPTGPSSSERTSTRRALGVDRREPDRDERRVPVPLERVEPLRRLDEASRVVRP